MTDTEWLVSTRPSLMISEIEEVVTPRKLRLLLCANFRTLRLSDQVPLTKGEREAILLAEQLADGEVDFDTVARKTKEYESSLWLGLKVAIQPMENTKALCFLSEYRQWYMRFMAPLLLREFFPNPFRKIILRPEWLASNDSTVSRIAQTIYDERAFDRMPILADALEDAGCDNADLLTHCRSGGEHVRGCWVIDLLLGKS